MLTNRDLYLAITSLATDAPARPLEEYLRALLVGFRSHKGIAALPAREFLALLSGGFTDEPAAYDLASAKLRRANPESPGGYDWCERILLGQIVDLHEMNDAGTLKEKWIELGVRAPRGSQWFNFDTRSYLECAAEGALGGWRPGDSGSRRLVPGPVAVQDAQGNIVSVDPRQIKPKDHAIESITWDQFAEFLHCGQAYE